MEVLPKENVSPFLYVRVDSLHSLTAESVETNLALPVEGALRTVPGIMSYRSSINQRGVAISMYFKPGTDLDLTQFQVQEALQSLANVGLLDMKKVNTLRFNPEASAVMQISVSHKNIKDPARVIREELKTKLEAIPEISKIEIQGLEPLLFQYKVSHSKLKEIQQPVSDFLTSVRPQSYREVIGQIPYTAPNHLTSVKAYLKEPALKDIESATVKKKDGIALLNIADKRIIEKSNYAVVHKDQMATVFVEIYNKDSANLFDLKKHVQETLENTKTQPNDLSKLEYEFVLDRTQDLQAALDDVISSLIQSVIISFLVILVFFRHLSLTTLIASTVPLSLTMTVLILLLKGASLNLLTLAGLVLSVGLVVDNAVVVVERIQQFQKAGKDIILAAAMGAQDMAPALLMSTLATIIIFLPVAFLDGNDTFIAILKSFQLPMIASLLAAYFIALLFVPLIYPFIPAKNDKSEEIKMTENSNQKKLYPYFLWIQKHRNNLLFLVVISSAFLFKEVKNIQAVDIESPRDPYTQISVKYGDEVSIEKKRNLFIKVKEALLSAKNDLEYNFLITDFNPDFNSGVIQIFPNKSDDWETTCKLLDERVGQFIKNWKSPPGESLALGYGSYVAGVWQPKTTIRLSGTTMSKLLNVQAELKEKISSLEGIEKVYTAEQESGQKVFSFIPSVYALKQAGINIADLSKELTSFNSNLSLQNLDHNGLLVSASVSVGDGKTFDIEELQNTTLSGKSGQSVLIKDLGKFEPIYSLSSISRKEGVVEANMAAYFKPDTNAEQQRKLRDEINMIVQNHSFPPGYGPPVDLKSQRIAEQERQSLFVVLLAVLLIYLILASLFESILVPIAIMLTVPLAVLFGVAGLYYLGYHLDVMARISLVMLVGIATNNAIILVDVFKKLQEEGLPISQAIVKGCCQRFRSVVMSTSSTVLGILPVALGNAKLIGIPYATLGISIISGILLSSIVTLLILPAAYQLADGIENWFKQPTTMENPHLSPTEL